VEYDDERMVRFYAELQKALDLVDPIYKEHMIITGDYNARMGCAQEGSAMYPLLGPGITSEERREPDATHLQLFCMSKDLILANSHFTNPCGSWHQRNDPEYPHTNDHTAVSESLWNMGLIDECKIHTEYPVAEMGTDHLPTILRVRIPVTAQHRGKKRTTPSAAPATAAAAKLNFRALRDDPALAKTLNEALEARMPPPDEIGNDVRRFYSKLISTANDICRHLLPTIEAKDSNKGWFEQGKDILEPLMRTEQHRQMAWERIPKHQGEARPLT